MKKITLGILAHVDSGKTTLSEAMLYTTGNIARLGRVDHRDSFLDTFSLERERGITIFSKQALLRVEDTEFTLLDTPGHVDFSAETERTLQVLDYAVLVISGTDGVQSHTQTLWKLLQKYRVPCFLFVNKMDLDGADRERVLLQIRQLLSDRCVDFSVTDSDAFFENAALCDEALFAEYDADGTVGKTSLVRAVQQRKLCPCLFGSVLRLQGVDALLTCLNDYTVIPEYPSAFAARVFKIAEDAQKNRLTYLKVTGGTLRVREVLASDRNGDGEKVNQIRLYSGEKFTAVDAVTAGTVCAVTGVTFTRPGDGLGEAQDGTLPVLEPVLTYRVMMPDGTDAHTALQKLRILEAEDPQLRVAWHERLKEIQVQLMGDIQLEVLKTVIAERFGFQVTFGKGNIIYKETIKDTVEGVGHFEPLRHYAEVHLLLKPGERDSGLVIKTDCKEDLLDKNWQRLIVTHLYEKTHLGVLTGAPITDMEIILKSGRAHPKHTEGGDFRQATYRAVRQGLRSAESVLLEPVYDFSLEVPSDCVGRALHDIQRMAGSFDPPEQNGESTRITGTAPVSEMSDYTREVLQYTHGKGRLACSLKGYQECHNADEVIAAVGYQCDADTDNTADSVFCSHGAGYVVKWNEVPSMMHLPSVLAPPPRETVYESRAQLLSGVKDSKDIFALDKELMQIFENTYGPVKPRRSGNTPTRTVTAPAKESRAFQRKAKQQFSGTEYLLVDGYNVIFAWEHLKKLAESSIDGARNALQTILCNYQGYKKCEVILVFDAYKVKGNQREVEKVDNINIVYTKEAETADMYIEKVSHQLAKHHRVRVVTSDALEQLIILGNGALRVSSRAFLEEVRQAEDEIRQIIAENG